MLIDGLIQAFDKINRATIDTIVLSRKNADRLLSSLHPLNERKVSPLFSIKLKIDEFCLDTKIICLDEEGNIVLIYDIEDT
jgi:hypothetical protein